MNRPDKVGEPSMEEILASIRQIIADEPSNDLPEPVIEANPLVPQSSSVKTPDTRVPLADRLSGVLKDGPLPPTSPFGSKRPLSFDQDLADMLDARDPLNGSATAAPKPDLRVQPGLATPHPMVSKSFVPATPTYVPQTSIDDSAGKPVESAGPSVSAPEPVVAAPPLGDVKPTVEAAPSPPPQTYGFPPLRKSSFYPPQPKTPVMSTLPLGDVPSASSAGSAPATDSDIVVTPASIDDALRRIDSGLGGFIPGGSGAGFTNAAKPFGTPSPTVVDTAPTFSQMHDPVLDGGASHRDVPEVRPAFVPSPEPQPSAPPYSFTPAPSFAQEPSPVAAPTYPSFGSAAPHQPFVGPAPNPFGAFDGRPADVRPAAPVERPVEPRAYPDPFAASTRPHSGFNGHYGAEPMSADAAHSALDALAQGLAASAAHGSEAIPLVTPIIDVVPEPDVRSPPRASPSTLPATVSPVGSMPVNRTLEDAVADMLRPMLQQWVADNMPRIIEKALRSEVEKTLKPGQK
jgi:cell pole-organizing protein PopZ